MSIQATRRYREDGRLRDCGYYVYILTCRQPGENYVYAKIGYCLNPTKRMTELSDLCPFPLETMYVFDTNANRSVAQKIKCALHKAFRPTWVRSEWYKLPEERAEFDRMRKAGLDLAKVKYALWSVTNVPAALALIGEESGKRELKYQRPSATA